MTKRRKRLEELSKQALALGREPLMERVALPDPLGGYTMTRRPISESSVNVDQGTSILKGNLSHLELKRQYKWDMRFLRLAQHIAQWSKDPSTKVGAVIVKNRRVLSTGFNGFPESLKDDPELYLDRVFKYANIIHAEINALSQLGGDLSDAIVYTSFPCCPECFVSLSKVGIKRIVSFDLVTVPGRTSSWVDEWKHKMKITGELAKKLNVEWTVYRDV